MGKQQIGVRRKKDREITGLMLLKVMEKLYVPDGLQLRIFSKHDITM